MLDKNEIIEIAKIMRMKPWMQEKHYIQTLILYALAEKTLIFKGGTYLWMFHGLPRFSEDLDFTFLTQEKDDIAEDVKKKLETFGVENEIRKIEENDASLSFRVDAKGPLYEDERTICYTYVEISKREKPIKPPLSLKIESSRYGLIPRPFLGMDLEEVLAEKIRATITRNKARDVYDLYFLIKNKNIPFNQIIVKEKMKYYDKEFDAEIFKNKIYEKEALWKEELTPLLFTQLPDFNVVAKEIMKHID